MVAGSEPALRITPCRKAPRRDPGLRAVLLAPYLPLYVTRRDFYITSK